MSIEFTPEEQRAWDAIGEAYGAIIDMGLVYNNDEFAMAIHRLQDFVKQHICHRLDPEKFSNWYGD